MEILDNIRTKNTTEFRELEYAINNKLLDAINILYKKAHAIFKTMNVDFGYTDTATANNTTSFADIYFKIHKLHKNVHNILQTQTNNSEIRCKFMNILEDTLLLTNIIHSSPPVINKNIHSLLLNRIYIVSNYFEVPSQCSFKSNDIYDTIIKAKRLNRIIRNDKKISGVWGGLIVNNLNACRLFAINEIAKE